jgi:hypothetical protein
MKLREESRYGNRVRAGIVIALLSALFIGTGVFYLTKNTSASALLGVGVGLSLYIILAGIASIASSLRTIIRLLQQSLPDTYDKEEIRRVTSRILTVVERNSKS